MDDEWLEPKSIGGEFEFEVGKGNHPNSTCRYVVQLPHQCDAWEIAADDDKATAIAQMERFVAEAQLALTKLRERP